MKIILTGATGYVGEGVMLELLRKEQIEKVLSVSRRPVEIDKYNSLTDNEKLKLPIVLKTTHCYYDYYLLFFHIEAGFNICPQIPYQKADHILSL